MELKHLIAILKKDVRIFFLILAIFAFSGLIFFRFQKEKLVANLMINVTRKGTQSTQEFRYDSFYRLQADERFADTVVSWTGSPSILGKISEKSGYGDNLELEAKRLSSQMIEVVFDVKDVKSAQKISDSIVSVLNEQIEKINEKQQDEAWFYLVSNPVQVLDGKIKARVVLWASLITGLFFALMGVVMKSYLKD